MLLGVMTTQYTLLPPSVLSFSELQFEHPNQDLTLKASQLMSQLSRFTFINILYSIGSTEQEFRSFLRS